MDNIFPRGVAEQSLDAIARSQRMLTLRDTYRGRFLERGASPLTIRLIDLLFERPVTWVLLAALELNVSQVWAGRILRDLQEHGIVREVTGRRRNRFFVAQELLRTIEGDL